MVVGARSNSTRVDVTCPNCGLTTTIAPRIVAVVATEREEQVDGEGRRLLAVETLRVEFAPFEFDHRCVR